VPDASAQSTVETRQEGRSWLLFAVIVTAIMLAATGGIVATWNCFTATNSSLFELVFPGLTLAFIASTILAARVSTTLVRVTYHVTAIWVGFVNFALFASAAMWVALGFLDIFRAHIDLASMASFALAVVIGVSAWSLIRARRLAQTVMRIQLTPAAPASWRGRTAALVTDPHLGNILRAPISPTGCV